jgi:2-polyprenyl-6-methoxyphenol hydroxylase-like FAD-dependent oxidoreductase
MLCRYTIPGKNGSLEEGKRLLNYVWYTNIAGEASELQEAMTDTTGRKHHHTLPIGKMQSAVWDKQRALARRVLPQPFAELIDKTTQPFISTISDIDVSQPVFHGGKLLFVGDALMAFRPHVACSTNQAALNAMLVEKLLTGEIDLTTWETQVLDYAHATRLRSITWGCWYQVGYYAFFASELQYLATLCGQGFRRLYRSAFG